MAVGGAGSAHAGPPGPQEWALAGRTTHLTVRLGASLRGSRSPLFDAEGWAAREPKS